MSRVQQTVEHIPSWANWAIIAGSWLVSFLQPLALILTIIWTGLQIWTWVEKRRKK